MFYVLEPEVPAGWGPETIADSSVDPPIVEQLHLEFSGWLGDDLIESFPCFAVSRHLADSLVSQGLSGFALADCHVSKSVEFEELYPGRDLPDFMRLCVSGRAGAADFGLSADHRLVVSSRAKAVLERYQLQHCDTEAWPGS